MPKVGVIANPAVAGHIGGTSSRTGSLPNFDRAQAILRILAGLCATGVDEVLIMPENGGIRAHLMRAIDRGSRMGPIRFPKVTYLNLHVTAHPQDSSEAARQMRDQGVGAIVVLGGDGASRVVVSRCGNTPIAAVSTSASDAFSEMRDPTVVGLAVGLAVTGQVPCQCAFSFNKRLEVKVNDLREIALVDVMVAAERFVSLGEVWKTEHLCDLFVTFGLPDTIGMSSIVGLLAPLNRGTPEGRHVRFLPLETAMSRLAAPIAPGWIEEVGVGAVEKLTPDVIYLPSVSVGAFALDGEHEMTFRETDHVSIRLQTDAFRTINVPACMDFASRRGLLFRECRNGLNKAYV